MRKAQKRLAETVEAWHRAETAYAEERSRYIAAAWGDPPTWSKAPSMVHAVDMARLDELGLEAAAAGTEYEDALEAYAKTLPVPAEPD